MEEKRELVAVYGSLRKGMGNHRLIAPYPMLGKGKTNGYMVSLGAFPGLLKSDQDESVVEVYEVTSKGLMSLDILEGNGSFYTRDEVDVDLGNRTVKAWVYFLPRRGYDEYPVVESGDWVEARTAA